jgi:hypothetical protein
MFLDSRADNERNGKTLKKYIAISETEISPKTDRPEVV